MKQHFLLISKKKSPKKLLMMPYASRALFPVWRENRVSAQFPERQKVVTYEGHNEKARKAGFTFSIKGMYFRDLRLLIPAPATKGAREEAERPRKE